MERKGYIDILRGSAAIGVIMLHVACNNWYGFIGSKDWIAFTVYAGIARASVPIFFMISGALFLEDKKNVSVKYMTRHFVKLFFALLFWGMVYQFANGNHNFVSIIKSMVHADTQSHLWFLYSIMGIYLVTPIIKVFTQNASKRMIEYALLLLFVFGSILPLAGYIPHGSWVVIWLQKVQPGDLSIYVGYFILGHYLDKWHKKDKKNYIVYFLGIIGCVLTVSAVLYDCISTQEIHERFWNYNMPWVALASIGVFIFVKNNFSYGIIYKLMHSIAKYSLGIYLIHFLFIMILWKNGVSTFSFVGIVSVPVITLVVLLLSFVTAFVASKIKTWFKVLFNNMDVH
ncbi:MAG: acyltransferase family protein [Clostridium sp.]|nr:acyltransferase family protein [Clostridium sp.]